jgi:seryl-tRNA synthetase
MMERVANERQIAFRDALVGAGVLAPSSVKGVWGKGPSFVATYGGLDRFVTDAGAGAGPEVYRFPPIYPRDAFLRTDYLRSFPDLMGSIHGFDGGSAEHAALLRDLDGGADWAAGLEATDLMLLPAACYPIYPMISGALPEGGRLFDVLGSCFRHEPSDDPARMQAFHQHEFVHVGSPESALAFRDHWLARAPQMMDDLGIPVQAEVANDPFFGRAGSMLAANQRDSELKFEVVATVSSEEQPTAIVSCNCHLDHLTVPFEITLADGGEAHSACVGFGMERIVLGLFATHGLDTERWPHDVRKRLWG